jgi:hypothetical protein
MELLWSAARRHRLHHDARMRRYRCMSVPAQRKNCYQIDLFGLVFVAGDTEIRTAKTVYTSAILVLAFS